MIKRETLKKLRPNYELQNPELSAPMREILAGMVDRRPTVRYARFTAKQLRAFRTYGVFCACIGQLIPGEELRCADLAWTNNVRSCSFPPPSCLVAKGIMVLLDAGTSPATAAAFGEHVFGELVLLDKTLETFPMSLVTVVNDGALGTVVGMNDRNGEPTEHVSPLLYPFEPRYIPPLSHFDFKLTSPREWVIPKNLAGYVCLEGLMDFPVQ